MTAWEIVSLKALSGHRLEAIFNEGLCGVADLSGEEFRWVLDLQAAAAFFARAELRNIVPTWPSDINLAPDTLHATFVAPRPGPPSGWVENGLFQRTARS